jgi:leucyl/phenylalanyl-tRNA--protein transferase
MSQLHWLEEQNTWFPPTKSALKDPDGLLAVGGDLTVDRLIKAYSLGIFPWYSDGQPLLWWSPDPRMVLSPDDLHLGRTLRKLLRKQPFRITFDQQFETVMRQCGTIARKEQDGSWITEEMIDAYMELHAMGVAHSVEVWQNDELVGGLYGIALGRSYFGESMYSLVSGASKVAFATLAQQLKLWGFELIDCQIHTQYLNSFGAKEIPRSEFEQRLAQTVNRTPTPLGNNGGIQKSVVTYAGKIPLLDWSQAWQMPEKGFDGLNNT